VLGRKWPDEVLYLGKEIGPFTELLAEYQTAHGEAAGDGECACKLCKRYDRLNWDLFLPPTDHPQIAVIQAKRRAAELGLGAAPIALADQGTVEALRVVGELEIACNTTEKHGGEDILITYLAPRLARIRAALNSLSESNLRETLTGLATAVRFMTEEQLNEGEAELAVEFCLQTLTGPRPKFDLQKDVQNIPELSEFPGIQVKTDALSNENILELREPPPEAGSGRSAPGEPGDADLQPFGWAPGEYLTKCSDCKALHDFTDKRSLRCRWCAVKAYYASAEAESSTPRGEAEGSLPNPQLGEPGEAPREWRARAEAAEARVRELEEECARLRKVEEIVKNPLFQRFLDQCSQALGVEPRREAPASPRAAPSPIFCPEKKKPGGCQLPNWYCQYPQCDEPPAPTQERP
jgi:hypothetical protein